MGPEAFREPSVTDLPILDPSPLQDLLDLGAGPGLVQELVGLLREDTPARLAALDGALAAGDAGLAFQEAHQLKGSLGNLGLVRAADLARQVEGLAREGRVEAALGTARALGKAYEEALAALQAAFPA